MTPSAARQSHRQRKILATVVARIVAKRCDVVLFRGGQLCAGALHVLSTVSWDEFIWFTWRDDSLFRGVASPGPHKGGRMDGLLFLRSYVSCCKTFCFFCILADHNAEHNVQRATILYAPLYPTFEDRLNRFRQAETSDLEQRGAERVINNAEIYGSQRSSEDASVDLVAPRPEDIPSPGPSEATMVTRSPGLIIRDKDRPRLWQR